MKDKLIPTIGLEIHVELETKSKMFCGCPADHFGRKPNTITCPVCLGLPGALPVPNKKAIESTIMLGLALGCKINRESKFDRKHYFYPDLPKGYQISQYDEPLCFEGNLTLDGSQNIRIRRVHLEEDTGKLQHLKIDGDRVSLVDFNRSGVPLVEIVTEPDIHSAGQAKEFAQTLQQIIRTIGVSSCDMEKGSMRLEANVSWGTHLGYKVEVKNLNSFRFIEKAIKYELDRQRSLLQKGILPRQETRGWSEKQNKTLSQRYKETEADYRYFPEPDIPPLELSVKFIEDLRRKIPELPHQRKVRFMNLYKIRESYAKMISIDNELSIFAEEAFKLAKKEGISIDKVAGEIVNKKINQRGVSVVSLVKALKKQQKSLVSSQVKLTEWVMKAITLLPKAVDDYKKGKTNAISVLIGKVRELSKGTADPILTKKLLEEKLDRKK